MILVQFLSQKKAERRSLCHSAFCVHFDWLGKSTKHLAVMMIDKPIRLAFTKTLLL